MGTSCVLNNNKLCILGMELGRVQNNENIEYF